MAGENAAVETQSTTTTATETPRDVAVRLASAMVGAAAEPPPAAKPGAATGEEVVTAGDARETAAAEEAAAAAAAADKATAAEAAKDPKAEKHAARFAALAKREQAVTTRESAFKAEVKTVRAELETGRAEIAEWRGLAKSDPVKLLERLGLKYEDITRRVLNDGKPTTTDEVAELRARLDQKEKDQASKEEAEALRTAQAHVDTTIRRAKADIEGLAVANAAKYPLTTTYPPAEVAEMAFELVARHHHNTKKVMPYEDALAHIEGLLEEQRDKLTKVPAKTPPKTLTNTHAAARFKVDPELSMEQRKAKIAKEWDAEED